MEQYVLIEFAKTVIAVLTIYVTAIIVHELAHLKRARKFDKGAYIKIEYSPKLKIRTFWASGRREEDKKVYQAGVLGGAMVLPLAIPFSLFAFFGLLVLYILGVRSDYEAIQKLREQE